MVLVSPQGRNMRYVLRMCPTSPTTRPNTIDGMGMTQAYGATRIKIHGDSNLIAQQVMKE
jgi:hypothetical protein